MESTSNPENVYRALFDAYAETLLTESGDEGERVRALPPTAFQSAVRALIALDDQMVKAATRNDETRTVSEKEKNAILGEFVKTLGYRYGLDAAPRDTFLARIHDRARETFTKDNARPEGFCYYEPTATLICPRGGVFREYDDVVVDSARVLRIFKANAVCEKCAAREECAERTKPYAFTLFKDGDKPYERVGGALAPYAEREANVG